MSICRNRGCPLRIASYSFNSVQGGTYKLDKHTASRDGGAQTVPFQRQLPNASGAKTHLRRDSLPGCTSSTTILRRTLRYSILCSNRFIIRSEMTTDTWNPFSGVACFRLTARESRNHFHICLFLDSIDCHFFRTSRSLSWRRFIT